MEIRRREPELDQGVGALMDVSKSRLKALMDEVRKVLASVTNQNNRQYWQALNRKTWEPAFIRTLPDRKKNGKIPFVLELGLGMWSQILGFNLRDYYHDPLTYATAQLEMKLFHAKHFSDDTWLDSSFRLLIATTLEGTLMGVNFGFTEEGHPWLDYQHPPIKTHEDLSKLPLPDFFQTGSMPLLHRFYAQISEALDEDFWVKFPDWIMGPFGVAAEMRGFDRLLIDMVLDTDFIRELLAHIVKSRQHWQAQLDAFLGIQRHFGLLGNDDVNCPTLSPALYRDFLLPIEKDLSRYYGGLYYWHSCGRTTPLLPYISEIPELSLFHCGPWTDISQACQTFADTDTALEIMIEPVDLVQMATPRQMREYLREVAAQIPAETNCYIKVDSIEVIRDVGTELQAVKNWIGAAREVLG